MSTDQPLPSYSRAYITSMEAERAIAEGTERFGHLKPEARLVTDARFDIYPVLGTAELVKSDGQVVVVPDEGYFVKILGEVVDEVWCFSVQDLSVRLPGQRGARIREGTAVTLLPANYRDLVRDAKRQQRSAQEGRPQPGG